MNNPILTSEKFVVLSKINEKVFKTGDLCKINENNEIEFIGRKDEQVKIRGYRVSLIEIEKMLVMYPLISNAIVTDFYDTNNKKKLCAYYTGENSITKKEIKEYLKKVLPLYMIPDTYIKVNEFKMTINGKIDKNSLPNPNKSINETETEYIEPKTEMEKKLADIWRNILNIEKISIEDNLFDLGADSLSIIEFQTLTMNENLNINAQDIYINQTIRKLAEKIESNNSRMTSLDKQYSLINIEKLKLSDNKKNIENILLTGATGFLGIHVLNEILEKSKVNVYCLVRGRDNTFAEQRLKELYKFYFQKELKDHKNRIKIIYGDITKENLGVNSTSYKKLLETIDTVIHTAATVKHYGNANLFYKINILGTKNIIDFCKMNHAKLHYISTISVSGQYTEKESRTFTENDFWIEQNYSDNEYINSKFQAEYEILKEIKNNNLYAKIYRVRKSNRKIL